MAKVIYISGGERSGKSHYAQQIALQLSSSPIYLATARIWDENFKERVQRHQNERDDQWTTINEEKFLSQVNLTDQTVVIDCVTLWLTNWYLDLNNDVDQCLTACKKELTSLFQQDATLIIVSNEIGMGVHASTEVGRKFTELQGWINQFIASEAEEAFFIISGLPLQVK